MNVKQKMGMAFGVLAMALSPSATDGSERLETGMER